MSELKPCPFCGKPLHVFYNYRLKAWTWHCDTENCAGTMLGYDSADEAVAALNRRAQPANEPLTLEQLREMDGKPVWIVDLKVEKRLVETSESATGWVVFSRHNNIAFSVRFGGGLFYAENFGKTWLAYRRPPERSENDG